jgi:bla regulator protein BlaR1
MISESFSPLANHLWQSTLFACVAGLLTLALRRNSARVRHWLWVVSSLKFLVPFSALITLGSRVQWHTATVPVDTAFSVVLDQLAQPFTGPATALPIIAEVPATASVLPTVLWVLWACGFVGISCSWWIRWHRVRTAILAGSQVALDLPIRAISSPSFLEPGVFGVLRPVLVMPDGILTRLTPDQWRSVVAHELCHVRHRDNLIALLHMFVETIFWFHPLVWWIGTRIVQERENGCDEEVMRLGNEPWTYAQGILRVCELYLESPLTCVAGISGSSLKKRIEGIMANRVVRQLNPTRRVALVAAGLAAIVLPLGVGVVATPRLRAQADVFPTFAVASIKPTDPAHCGPNAAEQPGATTTPGRLHMCGALSYFIQGAYEVYTKGRGFNPSVMPSWMVKIQGAPAWLDSELYQIDAKADGNPPRIVMTGPMLQALFEDRLKLKVHRETRNVPVYELTAAKGGTRLQPSDRKCVPFDPLNPPEASTPGEVAAKPCGDLKLGKGTLDFSEFTLSDFAQYLGRNIVDRPIINKAEIAGRFNFHLEFEPDESTPYLRRYRTENGTGPSIFTAMQEQLGLRLERATGPHEFLVIDSVERPTEN